MSPMYRHRGAAAFKYFSFAALKCICRVVGMWESFSKTLLKSTVIKLDFHAFKTGKKQKHKKCAIALSSSKPRRFKSFSSTNLENYSLLGFFLGGVWNLSCLSLIRLAAALVRVGEWRDFLLRQRGRRWERKQRLHQDVSVRHQRWGFGPSRHDLRIPCLQCWRH